MLTPRFSCGQTESSVNISLYCPSVRASEVEIHVDETLLTVHVNPYFLRLNFSGRLLEDDESSAHYDPASGYLTVTLTKVVKGEPFADLDLLAKLLAPRAPSPVRPKIEIFGKDESTQLGLDDANAGLDGAAQHDWQITQTVCESLGTLQISAQKHYGFLDMYSGYFTHVVHTENEVNELGADAETLTAQERRAGRTQHEDEKWDEEHYMADYADDSSIQELLAWDQPHLAYTGDGFQFSEDETFAMLRLPRKEYLATTTQTHNLYLTLVTLLFSYAYDARTTQHDPTPESAWTISVLTPAFSALDPPPYPDLYSASEVTPSVMTATLVPCYRRALAFPLHRSFQLVEACRIDTAQFLSAGKRTVVRCLLEMKHILDHHETYYVYSKIWVDDFCSWTQACASDDVLKDMGNMLKRSDIAKAMIGWDLEGLEAAVGAAPVGESDSDDE